MKALIITHMIPIFMSKTQLEKELKLIRQRLDSIEEALAEEMNDDDKLALEEALREHKEGKSLLFSKARKY